MAKKDEEKVGGEELTEALGQTRDARGDTPTQAAAREAGPTAEEVAKAATEEQIGAPVLERAAALVRGAEATELERKALEEAQAEFVVFHRDGFAVPVRGRARANALIARGTHFATAADAKQAHDAERKRAELRLERQGARAVRR